MCNLKYFYYQDYFNLCFDTIIYDKINKNVKGYLIDRAKG